MRSLASCILAVCCAAFAAAQLDANTPILEFVAPTGNNIATCSNATFRWRTRLQPQSAAAAALFTLVLVPVDSGNPRPTTAVPGVQPTMVSLTGSAPSASGGPPGRRKRQERSTVTVRAGLLAPQGAYSLTALAVQPGWYILGGSDAMPADAGLVFLPSQPFEVHSGSSTKCLDNKLAGTMSPPLATQTTSPDSSGDERVHVSTSRRNAAVIAGAVLGGFFFAALVLGGLWYLRNRRRRSVEQWRDARAAQWAAFAAQQPSSSTGHGHDEKDPEREAKAREIAAMLREAGIREGAPRPTLRPEQFANPGAPHDSH